MLDRFGIHLLPLDVALLCALDVDLLDLGGRSGVILLRLLLHRHHLDLLQRLLALLVPDAHHRAAAERSDREREDRAEPDVPRHEIQQHVSSS
jgi:hypothetical protein